MTNQTKTTQVDFTIGFYVMLMAIAIMLSFIAWRLEQITLALQALMTK